MGYALTGATKSLVRRGDEPRAQTDTTFVAAIFSMQLQWMLADGAMAQRSVEQSVVVNHDPCYTSHPTLSSIPRPARALITVSPFEFVTLYAQERIALAWVIAIEADAFLVARVEIRKFVERFVAEPPTFFGRAFFSRCATDKGIVSLDVRPSN